jgi:cysteine desulfurase
MSQNLIYLDHNATTPLHPHVKSWLMEGHHIFGNPSSIHWAGRESKNAIRNARAAISQFLNVSPLEIIFNSGASESNNTVIRSFFNTSKRNEFICSEVEHPSVLKTMLELESKGAVVHKVPVNREGFLDLEFYKSVLSEKTALVSIMMANNETGNLFPIKELCSLAHSVGAYFHTDAVQAMGKLDFNMAELGVDYASFSGHKFYALKGTGVLYAKKGSPQIPLITGGAQERNRRGGTENVLGIISFGRMCELKNQVLDQVTKIQQLRDQLQQRILKEIPGCTVTGGGAPRLPNTLSLVIDQIDGETLLMNLDIKGYAVSTGAACSSGNPEPSPVLLAMGLSRQEAQGSLRISIGWENTPEELNQFCEDLKKSVQRLRLIDLEHREQQVDL